MSFNVKELPSGCLEMKVAEVHTPSTMWLVDTSNERMSQKYYKMEALLKKVIERNEPVLVTRLYNVGDVVAVHDTESGAWCRAKIWDIYPKLSKYIYSLFLLDRGYSIHTESINIRDLPPEVQVLQFLCYHVQLFGIFPVSPKIGVTRPNNVALQAWSPIAAYDIEDLVKSSEAVYFALKVARKILYGDIYLKFNQVYVNLAHYMCENDFAYRDDRKFIATMEKAPFISFAETLTRGRPLLKVIDSMRKTVNRNTFCIGECDSEKPNSDLQQAVSSAIPENKLAAGRKSFADTSRENVKESKALGLLKFFEEMQNRDKSQSSFRNDPAAVSVNQSPQENLCVIGRGGRLKMLQTMYPDRKPGGICINTYRDGDSLNNDELTMFKDLSLNETKNLQQETDCKIFESKKAVYNERKLNFDTRNRYGDCANGSKYNDYALEDKSLPEETIFTRRNPVVFIPAGAERSMLCSRRKKSKDKKKTAN